MDFELTPDVKAMRDMVRRLMMEKVTPQRAAEIDRTDEFPWDLKNVFAEHDILALPFEDRYGGVGGKSLPFCVVLEEIARVNCAAAHIPAGQCLGSTPIVLAGDEQQKKKYLPRFASGEWLAAFGLTEPNAGSDVNGVQTTAVREGDVYVVNGGKHFITNGNIAGAVCLFVRTPAPDAGRSRLSCLVVEKGTPGFSYGKEEDKMGVRGSPAAELLFDNCCVPTENLLGKEGDGIHIALRTLDKTRPAVGSIGVGIAQGALDAAIAYAKSRVQFGQPIGKLQGIQFMLADMETQTQAARYLVYAAADAWDRGTPDQSSLGAAAKLFATETCVKVASDALQVHGGYGYLKEYPIERMYRDARLQPIVEGTNQIQRLVIARHLLGREF